jgi:hypothetical protein
LLSSCARELELGPYDLDDPCPLPLSAATLDRCRRMAEWHDSSLDWDYPPAPGPWLQPECDRFNAAARELLADIRRELAADCEVIDRQGDLAEHPDLDSYLADPKGFRQRP